MHIIEITVRDRVATHVGDDYYVCGNSDYVIHFDFDEEWDALDVKTARFIAEGNILYPDQIFSGSECPMPIIKDTNNIRVGVFAGNLQTSTPARVPAVKSILCGTGTPAAPEEDAYHQAMEEMAKVATEARTKAAESAQSAEEAAASAQAAGEYSANADEKAAAAAKSEEAARQYSANADKKAQEAETNANNAAGSAQAAATSARSAVEADASAQAAAQAAEAAKESSSANADDAEAAAKDAQTWAGRAETYAGNANNAATVATQNATAAGKSAANAEAGAAAAEQARQSANTSASSAGASADNAAASAQAAKASENAADASAKNAWEATKKMPIVGENGNWHVWSPSTGSYTDSGVPAQGPEGEKEMFFVAITTGSDGKLTSTQSYGNISYADQEGKFVVGRLDGAWPLEFVGYVADGVLFRHIRYYSANANEPVICAEEFVVKPNGEVTWSTRTWEAPNPHSLTITGATSATYDGSSAVSVKLPDDVLIVKITWDANTKAYVASHDYDAIMGAARNGKAVFVVDSDGELFPYGGTENGGASFRSFRHGETNMGVSTIAIIQDRYIIKPDGTVTLLGGGRTTPNPFPLRFTGAVEAEYDGKQTVTVNIPAGGGGGGGSIPDPGTAHQQLVSDADGKAVWDDRTHYTEYADVVVLEQTTLPVGTDEGMAYLTEAPIAEPTDGGEYNVKWNGADYTCKAAKTEMDGIACVMIGNAMAFGGDDTGEPFVALFLPADTAAALGAYAMIVPLDGSTEVVLSISGKSEVVHKLHEKYLPNLPTNLANGSTPYSLRQKSAAEEDAEYVLGNYASAFGYNTKAIGQQSHAEGAGTVASGDNAHAEGWDTKASSISAHAEGLQTTASGHYSHAEGAYTTASEESAHAEGRGSKATAQAAHAEGAKTTAEGDYSHAEGEETTASKESAHAEGYCTTAEGNYSHAEGDRTVASGSSSHAEGHQSVASGINSHAEGAFAKASGYTSHAEGSSTIASGRDQHVQGRYNVEDTDQYGKYAHIVGNGKDINNRSNAHTLDWDGNAWYAGAVEGTALILTSPNGTRFKITVDNTGTLSASAL